MIKINTDIPGWSDEEKLRFLAAEASSVKENGWIVEIGSFCGRSAYALGMNKHNSVKLSCFDKFPTMPELIPDTCFGNRNGHYNYNTFIENTQKVVNLETVRTFMPFNIEFMTFTKSIDLIFIDCIHTYEAVKADINTWHKFMSPKGVMIFDDYFDMFPGCVQAVDEFINEVNPTKKQLISHSAMAVYL